MSYTRVIGGEKNLKTGTRWSKTEIIEVYHLFKKLNGEGLHEHNPEIQKLANQLGRTVRSTEAQTLMFRNLERGGEYSHGNMNKLSKQVWSEFENDKNQKIKSSTNHHLELFQSTVIKNSQFDTDQNRLAETQITLFDEVESDQVESDQVIISYLNYKQWNEKLVDHYFNYRLEDMEIPCLLVYKELFEELTDFEFSFSDFEMSIEKEIRSKNFVTKFKELYELSIPHLISGKKMRKPIPEYFGFLIYLVLSLTEASGNNLRVSNVYDRINNVGKKRFGNNWGSINTGFARDTLEFVWKDLEDWSINFKAKKLGYLSLHDPKNSNRKFVSRIERHALLNSGHFQQIFDILIEIGITPKEPISLEKWIEIFQKNKNKIGNSRKILDYLNDDSDLRRTIHKFINDYYNNHFTDTIISSNSGTYRKPSIPLLFCLDELPQWHNEIAKEDVHFRTFSSEIEEDIINYQGEVFSVEHEYKEYSRKLTLKWEPNEEASSLIKGNSQRYSIPNRYKWLIFNSDLEEWVEVMSPTNAVEFIILVNEEQLILIQDNIGPIEEKYEAPWENYHFILFNTLSEAKFQDLNNLLGNKEIIEGSIEVEGDFLVDRRSTILKEFKCGFKYTGPIARPELFAKYIDSEKEWKLIESDQETGLVFTIPDELLLGSRFFVYEKHSNIKTHFSYIIESLEKKEVINVAKPLSKDQDGISLFEREQKQDDIFDIPSNFNRADFDHLKFNTWQQNLWKIFKSPDKDYQTQNKRNFKYNSNDNGERLLSYLSISKSIDTYKFASLIRELHPEISSQFSKRILIYWRELGYINFSSFGEKVKVSPTGLFFIETEKGLKAFLTGYRNQELINKLEAVCNELNLILKLTKHSEKHFDIFPHRIEIYDKLGDLDNFKKLANKTGVEYINNIENPYNSAFSMYQLACFYTQKSINELDTYLISKPPYETDHHRKLIFDPKSGSWKESTKDVSNIIGDALIRYDGFKDRQMIHIYKDDKGVKKLEDYSLCSFKLITDNVFLKKRHIVQDVSDFYVPLNMSLPYWIERGLIMMNARIPVLETFENKSYRVYKNIHDDIIKLIETKLNQQSNNI